MKQQCQFIDTVDANRVSYSSTSDWDVSVSGSISFFTTIPFDMIEARRNRSVEKTDASIPPSLQLTSAVAILKHWIISITAHLVLVATTFLYANTTLAIVTDPQSLAPANQKIFQDVSPLLGNDEMPSVNNLFVGWVGVAPDLLLVAQIRNNKCIADKCPTYIISYTGGNKRIVLVAYLPAKMAVSDVVKGMCARCDRIYTLMFEDSSGARYFFGVTNSYAVIFDRSLRDYRK